MENFVFDNKTTIIFGKATEDEVAKHTQLYGKKVLLHYGGGSIKRTGLYDQVVKSLNDSGVDFIELGGVKPNPRLSLVREGIKLSHEHDVDFILAVGGGSVIDSAKAIAIGVKGEHDVWDYYAKPLEIKEVLPVGVVLTLPAAGSESSTSSVITNEDGWLKRGRGDIKLRPKFAIMNPELTFTLPNFQTACGVTDMIAHIMERYFTNTKHVDFTDHLCEGSIKTIMKQAKIAIKHNDDYDARAEIMWAGTLAHNGLLGTGREEDWSSHMIEHEISGIYDVAHGAGLSIIFPAWMSYVYKHDVNRFAQFANRIFDIEVNFHDLEETALLGIQAMKNFFNEIGLPTTLAEVDIDADRFEEMARKATLRGPIGNFVKLNKEDIVQIYKIAAK